jgi:nucleotide-binding universal stress UspA family protein
MARQDAPGQGPAHVPQPHVSRLTPFAGHPAVVGIVPDQPELVLRTALSWAQGMGGAALHVAYADPMRYVVEELPDGSVRHADVDPDVGDDSWARHAAAMEQFVAAHLDGTGVPWRFVYLAGRPDRALTHLARAVDAAVIIVGAKVPRAGVRTTVREFLEGSVAVRLVHHQHRPVLTVPLSVVDWKAQLPWG